MPRSLVHLLLSLLLLVTQQLALLHATAHAGEGWHPAAGAAVSALAQAEPGTVALPEWCALCVDGAQVAVALPAPAHRFRAPAQAHDRPPGRRAAVVVRPDAPAFLPRGPPATC
jgi:hypothetical protein